MLRRNGGGRLVWGPGHLSTWTAVDDPGLFAFMAYGFLQTAVALGQRLDKEFDEPPQDFTDDTIRLAAEMIEWTLDDSVVPVLVTSLRHGIELVLKAIILQGRRDGIDPSTAVADNGHNFLVLLERAKKVYRQAASETLPEEFVDLVQQIDKIAPTADSWRYPMSRDEADHTVAMKGRFVGGILAVPWIDVTALTEAAKQMCAAWIHIVDHMEALSEFRAEMRSDCDG